MRVMTFAVAITMLTSIGGAETRKEIRERTIAEWTKFETEVENVCIDRGEAFFAYAPLDRSYFRPIHFSPTIATDFLKRVASGLTSLDDPRIKEALEGPFNTAVNDRIEGLRTGRFNIITVAVAKGIGFSITPLDHQSEDVLVWVSGSLSNRLLDVLGGGKPKDTIYLFASDGSMRPLDAVTRPKWLTTDNFYEVAWSKSGSDRLRLKKMVRCKYEPLPK
jgi:hypothetical protein